MRFTLLVILFLISLSAGAQTAFCHRDQSSILKLLAESENRIVFRNQGGILKGGVCWWHSRLQRSSIYLTKYAPFRPRPDQDQVNRILSSLKSMRQVVTIPGYHNFSEFTSDHQTSIQRVLELWQRQDGLLNFQWLRGISGRYRLPAQQMEARMRKLYQYYSQSPHPVWVMAQMKGITSHSFLIRQMESLPSGYVLEVVDSNKPTELRYVRYQFGDQYLKLQDGNTIFVPYVGFQEDFRKIGRSIARHCSQSMGLNKSDALIEGPIMKGEIEVRRGKKR